MKIGMFDSGVGGLTVLKSVRDTYDKVDIVYLGDTARVPYGIKSKETIITYAKESANFLISQNVDMILIACNSVSANAMDVLQETFDIPIIGVIEAGVEAAVKSSKTKHVGIIGTTATINSNKYQERLEAFNIKTYGKACPLFVPIVEEKLINTDISKKTVEFYLKEFKDIKDIDTIILGCTHYPLLEKDIKEFLPHINLVSSSDAIVSYAKDIIKNEGNAYTELYFTDISENTSKLVEYIMGKKYDLKYINVETLSLNC
ncbi:glutamate racemase [Hydrogenobaculum acidophilum]